MTDFEFRPLKAIRNKCLDCSGGSANEVRLCPIKDCPLYQYRSGHNPNRKGATRKGDPDFGKKMMELKQRAQGRSE